MAAGGLVEHVQLGREGAFHENHIRSPAGEIPRELRVKKGHISKLRAHLTALTLGE